MTLPTHSHRSLQTSCRFKTKRKSIDSFVQCVQEKPKRNVDYAKLLSEDTRKQTDTSQTCTRKEKRTSHDLIEAPRPSHDGSLLKRSKGKASTHVATPDSTPLPPQTTPTMPLLPKPDVSHESTVPTTPPRRHHHDLCLRLQT